MIYTENTKKAMIYAYKMHDGQVDKSGIPYIVHPILVANSMSTEDETITALLHDVVEDTSATIDDIIKLGFNNDVIEALKLLTHKKEDDYIEYIKKIKTNNIARKVKLADIAHNSDFTRISDPVLIDRLSKKYSEAKKILTED